MPVKRHASRLRHWPAAFGLTMLALSGCSRPALPKPVEPFVATPDAKFRYEVPEAAPPIVELPVVQTTRFDNGVELWFAERPGSAYVSLSFASRGGTLKACDSAELVQLTARMMAEGGLVWTDERKIDFAELRGERVRFAANHEDVSFGITALSEDIDPGLVILSRTIQHPLLDAGSFDRMRLAELEAQRSRANRQNFMFKLAATAALGETLGGRLVPADFARIKSATVADVRRCYKELLDPEKSVVVVVGDVSFEQAKDAARKHFATWVHSKQPATVKPLSAPWREHPTVSFISMGESKQTDLMLLQPAPSLSVEEDEIAFGLLARLLAGSLAARADVRLRHQAAVTYGSSFELHRARDLGLLSVSASVERSKTGVATEELISMLAELRTTEVTPSELENAKAQALVSVSRSAASNGAYANRLRELFVEERSPDTLEKIPARIQAISPSDLRRVAQKYLRPEAVQVAATGDPTAEDKLRFVGPVENYRVQEKD